MCYECIPSNSFQCTSFTCLRSHQEQNKPNILLSQILAEFSNKQSVSKSLFDCPICCSSLIDPITTQCGHTFCKQCLSHLPSRYYQCPLCRHTLGRLGKVNQLLVHWFSFLFNSNSIMNEHSSSVALIQLNISTLVVPSQPCLFHLSTNNSILEYMSANPNQDHYAICLFTKDTDHSFYEYGTMVQLTHIDIVPGLSHIVIQAMGLFRVKINQISFDLFNCCYVGDITRLDDRTEPSAVDSDWNLPIRNNKLLSNQPRPVSMRLGNTLPSFKPLNTYLSSSCPSWISHMTAHRHIPASLNTFLPSPSSPSDQFQQQTVNTLIDQQLLPLLNGFFTKHEHHVTQYRWYLQKEEPEAAEALIWWLGVILPLTDQQKLYLFKTHTLLERITQLISWLNSF